MEWYSAVNFEAYSSLKGVSSDHRIATAKIRLSLRRNAARTTTFLHYDWFLLNNRDIANKSTLTRRNKFDTLQEISEKHTPNEEYENFVNPTQNLLQNAFLLNKELNLESHGSY